MLEDTSIISTEFLSENFRIQDVVAHSVEAIEKQLPIFKESEYNPHNLHEKKSYSKHTLTKNSNQCHPFKK